MSASNDMRSVFCRVLKESIATNEHFQLGVLVASDKKPSGPSHLKMLNQ